MGWYGDTPQTQPGQVPTPPRGLLAWLRDTVGGWLGPRLSKNTPQELRLGREEIRSGPSGIVFPWFLPYQDDSGPTETAEMRRAYREMWRSPDVKAAVCPKIFGVGALDLSVHPADKRNRRDGEIADFVKWNLTERIKGGSVALIWSILSGMLPDGYSVCERVFQPEEHGQWSNKIGLFDHKAKDVDHDIVLQTDEFRNIVSLLGIRYNPGTTFSPNRFTIAQHMPLYGRPVGMSDFSAAYSSYWTLDTTKKLRLMGAEKRALPLIWGQWTHPSQQSALDTVLAAAKSQSWISLPVDVKLGVLEMAAGAESYFQGLVRDLKHDIFLAIQFATLQAVEGEGNNIRGNSAVHKKTSDLPLWYLAKQIEAVLNDRTGGLVRDIVDLNYVVREYPRVTLSSPDLDEQQTRLEIYKGAWEMGIDISQEQFREEMSLEAPRNAADVLAGKSDGGGQPGGDGDPFGGPGGGPGDDPEADQGDHPQEDQGEEGGEEEFGEVEFCEEGENRGKPGPCPQQGEQTSEKVDKRPQTSAPAGGKLGRWAKFASKLPAASYRAAKSKVVGTYKRLAARHGKAFAIAIMSAGIAGLPLPVPGSSILTAAPVIAVAELVRKLRGSGSPLAKMDELSGSREHVERLGRMWIRKLLAEWRQELQSQKDEATVFAEVVKLCGGPGSRKPGPCPRGEHKRHEVARAHANAAQHRLQQANHAHKRQKSDVSANALAKAQVEAEQADLHAGAMETRADALGHTAPGYRPSQAKLTPEQRAEGARQRLAQSKAARAEKIKDSGKVPSTTVDSGQGAGYNPGRVEPTQPSQEKKMKTEYPEGEPRPTPPEGHQWQPVVVERPGNDVREYKTVYRLARTPERVAADKDAGQKQAQDRVATASSHFDFLNTQGTAHGTNRPPETNGKNFAQVSDALPGLEVHSGQSYKDAKPIDNGNYVVRYRSPTSNASSSYWELSPEKYHSLLARLEG